MRAGVYITVVSVMAALKEARDHESELARTDPGTEVANARAFREMAAVELERARRYKRPLTLAFIDVDNFKAVNDKYGHDVGDTLLRELAATIKRNIRTTDAVARVGGDEFVVLFPETDGQPARELLDRIRKIVHDVVRKNGTPMTLSVGAVTFSTFPSTVDEIIKRADDLMYDVKRHGKDGVAHAVYSADVPPEPAGQAGQAVKA
jgi:diguanylate cyclase (GGDEF)-like protein